MVAPAYATGFGGGALPAVPVGSGGTTISATAIPATSIPSTGGATTTVPSVSSSDPTTAFAGVLQQEQAANMQYLMLQNQMQQENQQYSTLSNVLKVRHDTAKNSISNIH